MDKVKVAVLGSTGIVGQVFTWMLSNHQWYDPIYLSASPGRNNKRYGDTVNWVLPYNLPEAIVDRTINAIDYDKLNDLGIKIVFSALPSDVAASVEPELRQRGFHVFTNAGAMRYENDVPILIPEVNCNAIDLIAKQGYPDNGFIIANANCSVSGLAIALAPLVKYGITEVFVSTYQSISGAGYPGLSAMDISGNVIPFIQNEESKIAIELQKILGVGINTFPFCVRVPTLIGHLETVWLKFKMSVTEDDIIDAWRSFRYAGTTTPSLPEKPVIYSEIEYFPQTKMCFQGTPPGMPVFTGRLKKQNCWFGFVLLVNNLVRGAAGGSIANSEVFLAKYGDRA
jgi:aspartate-semialdehyde dehydrogenase